MVNRLVDTGRKYGVEINNDKSQVMRVSRSNEIKMRIAIPKEAFNRKMSLLTSKLNIELRKELVGSYVWRIALYD